MRSVWDEGQVQRHHLQCDLTSSACWSDAYSREQAAWLPCRREYENLRLESRAHSRNPFPQFPQGRRCLRRTSPRHHPRRGLATSPYPLTGWCSPPICRGVNSCRPPSDSDGVVPGGRCEGRRLLGEAAAEHLRRLCDRGGLPAANRLGVVLAGDFWAEPGCTRRGGGWERAGSVWSAFRRHLALGGRRPGES